ncbi:reverse transcriptase domain-containing protein [Tanacetum coccineum]
MTLESGKLNHLIKDVRQRGRGNTKGRDAGKDKVINMIRSWPNDRKRKSVKRDKSWMKAPIVFPPLSMKDASNEPLIIEVVMEGYLVRRIDLVGFAGGVVKPLGKIEMEVVFDDEGLFRTVMIKGGNAIRIRSGGNGGRKCRIASRKKGRLQRYFEAHPIKVITDQPLKQILNKAQASGKLAKYSVELGAYNILPNKDDVERWTLFTDGASNSKGSGAGLVLISASGVEFTASHARKMKVQNIDVKVDSKLVASQINGSYVASSTSMIKYLATTKECIAYFKTFVVQNIPRNLNQKADILSKLATYAFDHLTKKVLVKAPYRPTTSSGRSTWDLAECTSEQDNTVVAHPQANGLVDRANKSLMEGIKARLGRERTGWADMLPNVLWAHRTFLKQSNSETSFSLTYRSEAVIPTEIGMPTHRTMMIREDENEDELRLNMDLLQERREAATIREAKYKTKMK